MSAPRPLRIGFAAPYLLLVEPSMAPGFREERRADAARWAGALATSAEVVDAGLITSLADGEAAGARFAEEQVDAVVLAPVMVAPPEFALAALDGARVPVVLWTVPGAERLAPSLTPRQAAANSMQVGSTMIANALLRAGRAFATVWASPEDDAAMDRARRAVRAAACAGRVRGSITLRIGETVPGYTDVEASAADLARLGVSEHDVAPDELAQAFADADAAQAGALIAELRRDDWTFEEFPLLEHSARLAVAVRRLADAAGAACGTVNCHAACLRGSEEIGIAACLAVSVLSDRGTPFSCTGDQPTAIALLIAKLLTGSALYCELNSIESSTGLALLSAGGEGDAAWARDGARPTVGPNHFFAGSRGAGAGVSFPVASGPATLLSLSPLGDRWRLAWAPGEVVESRYETLETPNAMFRFDSGAPPAVAEAWTRSGATHHAALAAGRLDLEIDVLAGALEIETTQV